MIEYMFTNPATKNWLTYGDERDQGWVGPGWYFWDETETECYGPYISAKQAELKLKEYANGL